VVVVVVVVVVVRGWRGGARAPAADGDGDLAPRRGVQVAQHRRAVGGECTARAGPW
jgi:hypothetical protein